MMVAARSSPVSAPSRNVPPLLSPMLVELPCWSPVLVDPIETPPPLLAALETPPFPLLAVSVCADTMPTNAVEAIAAIANPLMSFFIGSNSSPLTLWPPLAQKRASRPELRRASATPRHAATI